MQQLKYTLVEQRIFCERGRILCRKIAAVFVDSEAHS